jgi:iron complex outermembrane receptor protein
MIGVASCARLAGLGLIAICATAVEAQQTSAEVSLDSLLNTRISAASKYDQRAAEAPASVTIITSDDIRNYGYRNFQEVLEGVRGFYVSNDRNYPYLGTRGFSRPTDYNNRILVLVDGHTLNEPVWGGVSVGTDLPINLDAVERIEIVRGPGSVLYGSSAMFAVINVVTKSGTEIDGLATSANLGSAGMRQLGVAGGHAFGTSGSFAVSALASRSDGEDLYFAEYDAPETNFGRVRGLDWEERIGGVGGVQWGGVTARAGYRWRAKGIPTGAYDARFGDSRTETTDDNLWSEVALRREIRNAYRLTARLYADRYHYDGVYPEDAGPEYVDLGQATTTGAEAMIVWDASSRNRMTFGSDYRRVFRAAYAETYPDGSVYEDNAPFHSASVFAQNELHVLPRLTLVTGLRVDKMSDVSAALAPRVAVIATPDRRTTIKALYGEAYRAPSAAEARLTTTFYERNPELEPERIQTLELSLQRRLASPILANVSLYEYRISDLIDQVEFGDEGRARFENVSSSRGRGLELELDVVPGGPLSARLALALQRARDLSTEERLSNSPDRIGTLSVMARLPMRMRSAVIVRHESSRLTLDGSSTPDFVRTDLNLGYAFPTSFLGDAGRSADLSLRVTNLFDTRYLVPGGDEHRQTAITQDGRALTMRLDWRY